LYPVYLRKDKPNVSDPCAFRSEME
jgi:hypothetical protein